MDASHPPEALVAWWPIISSTLSLIGVALLVAMNLGRKSQKVEDDVGATANGYRALTDALADKADCERVTEIEQRVTDDHKLRREQNEKLNANLGRVSERLAIVETKVEAQGNTLRSLSHFGSPGA